MVVKKETDAGTPNNPRASVALDSDSAVGGAVASGGAGAKIRSIF
jgi:hypothetical protein